MFMVQMSPASEQWDMVNPLNVATIYIWSTRYYSIRSHRIYMVKLSTRSLPDVGMSN